MADSMADEYFKMAEDGAGNLVASRVQQLESLIDFESGLTVGDGTETRGDKPTTFVLT